MTTTAEISMPGAVHSIHGVPWTVGILRTSLSVKVLQKASREDLDADFTDLDVSSPIFVSFVLILCCVVRKFMDLGRFEFECSLGETNHLHLTASGFRLCTICLSHSL